MEKIKKHLKNNFAIYVVLVACLIVIGVAVGVNRTPKVEPVDTSMFRVVTLKEAIKLFEDDEAKILVMGVDNCIVTKEYIPYLKIAQAKKGYQTYYLDLNTIKKEDLDDLEILKEKLDIEYKLYDKVGKFHEFMENTPMTVIIKNKKMVYGYIGSMSTSTITLLADKYGVGSNETN